MADDPTYDGARRTPRRKARTPLALIIIGCAMIAAAIALVVDGAVADDRPPAHETTVASAPQPDQPDASTAPARAADQTRVRYQTTLTRDDPTLAAHVAGSVAGGGLATGADVVVVIEGPASRN